MRNLVFWNICLKGKRCKIWVQRWQNSMIKPAAYPGIFLGGGSTNSVEDRGQGEWGSGGGSTLVRGSTQFANE
jgi:hypothetical protein